MRPLSILIFSFALTLGGVVYFVLPSLMPKAPAAVVVQPRAPGGDVMVAARNLPAGTLLKAGDVRWQRWPEGGLDPNFLVKEKGADPANDIVGRVVLRGFVLGEPMASSRLLKSGEAGFLAAALGPGMRAASVRIDAVSGNGGFIVPGDHVDVLLAERFPITYGNNGDGAFTGTRPVQRYVNSVVLRNIRVLAIDQDARDMDNKPKVSSTATLEVDLAQAQKLALAAQMGVVSLSLRSFTQPETPENLASVIYDADVSPYFEGIVNRQSTSSLRVYHGATLVGQGK